MIVSEDALRYNLVAQTSFVVDHVHRRPVPNVFDLVTRPLVQRQSSLCQWAAAARCHRTEERKNALTDHCVVKRLSKVDYSRDGSSVCEVLC